MLLALLVWPLTTLLLRDVARFLFLLETPSTFRRSLRFFHTLHRKILHILSPSCFAVCGHHLSLSIAIVFWDTQTHTFTLDLFTACRARSPSSNTGKPSRSKRTLDPALSLSLNSFRERQHGAKKVVPYFVRMTHVISGEHTHIF